MTRPAHAKARATIAALLTIAAGCDFDTKGWLVDRTRVLGARTEAVADPSRTSLFPGERATVTWLVVGPSAPPRLSWSFVACLPPTGNYAKTRCEGPLFATGTGSSDGELVIMELATPTAAATRDAPELLFLSAFCENGAATLEPGTFTASCAGGGDALLASTRLRLASADVNHTPVIGDDAIRFGEELLEPARFSVPAGPCSGTPDAPIVQAGAEGDLSVRLDDQREVVAGEREGLLLSHVVTAGRLERQYSSLEPGENAPKTVRMKFTAPGRDAVDASGRLVRFFFILRDDRGAMSFAVRSLCVRP